jgi:indole-3-glycerol phosphate synthase
LKTLKDLAEDAFSTVESGYYRTTSKTGVVRRSLVASISTKKGHAIVCEIKFASPSAGKIDGRYDQVSSIAMQMEQGGAAGLSVLTEPKNFGGSITNLVLARESTNLPVIMKDVIVSEDQIVAAGNLGASAVLFIWEVFSEGLSRGLALDNAITLAKDNGLDVIVETHSKEGLIEAGKLGCDIIGINNRDLKTFKTSIETTIELLKGSSLRGRAIMSESGFESAADISYVVEKLKSLGSPVPGAFLIGTSIMKSPDIRSKVMEFTQALKLVQE